MRISDWSSDVCSSDLVSEDLVYQVTKALLDTHKDDFKAIHPNAALFNIENAGKSMVVPIHPGAAKFYAEMGVSLNWGSLPAEIAPEPHGLGVISNALPTKKSRSTRKSTRLKSSHKYEAR